ncbi:hypothetical protein B0H14DRAFT_3882380 [Mycena olivaceomarginata]|nr:hypothetical protein B0H14DRAFT_3882380 [Mycena olivaceomarginata]
MRELTTLHASMNGAVPPSPTAPTCASSSSSSASAPANADTSASNANTTKVGSPPQTGVSKRPSAKRARASGAVKREPVEDLLGGPRMGMGMAQRPLAQCAVERVDDGDALDAQRPPRTHTPSTTAPPNAPANPIPNPSTNANKTPPRRP